MTKNYFYLENPNWYKENFIIAKRNDADSCCKELYDDLANVFLNNRILPNGNYIEIYEMSKYIESPKGNYYETRINIKKDNTVLYKIGLGSDYIGASINWAINAGCTQKQCLDILKTSRTLGGHLYLPRWIKDIKNNQFIYEISLNIAKAGANGLYDRIDLFLNELSSWYKDDDCKLKPLFDKNKIWLNLFKNIDSFVEFFALESFRNPMTKEFINFVDEGKEIHKAVYIPHEPKEYMLFAGRVNDSIEKRNFELEHMSLNK